MVGFFIKYSDTFILCTILCCRFNKRREKVLEGDNYLSHKNVYLTFQNVLRSFIQYFKEVSTSFVLSLSHMPSLRCREVISQVVEQCPRRTFPSPENRVPQSLRDLLANSKQAVWLLDHKRLVDESRSGRCAGRLRCVASECICLIKSNLQCKISNK